jgi:streptogramin lyase
MNSRARLLLGAVFALAAFVPPAFPQAITEFSLPTAGSSPGGIAAGPDGNLWFTEFTYDSTAGVTTRAAIGRITTTGAVTEFLVPTPEAAPLNIVAGPDGNLWFTQADPEFGPGSITRITPQGQVTQFPFNGYPWDITVGPDGNLWFTEAEPSAKIGRITTTGVRTQFLIPSPGWSMGITSGSDGNLWFTEVLPGRIGRMSPAGNLTQFSLPTASGLPNAITVGADGNLWFTEQNSNQIGRMTPDGVVTEFAVPTPSAGLADITAGPDGNLWFTEEHANKIGRITRFGAITEFSIPTPDSGPKGITAGPDDAIWFTESRTNKIGRITTGAVADPSQILPVVGSTAGVGTSFFRTSVQLHNAGTTASTGRIVFYPSGTPGVDTETGLNFTLAPGQTQTIPDLLPAMGTSGLGSADISLTLGSAGNIPIVSARVFNDAGTAGTTGFAFNALTPDQALHAGRRGVLTIPLDLTNFRMNIGVRTLNAPVLMTVTVRDAGGAIAATVPKFFQATYHEQQTAGAFLNGLPLPPGGSITATVEAGAAIVYGATVDNRTGDPSLQIAAPAP